MDVSIKKMMDDLTEDLFGDEIRLKRYCKDEEHYQEIRKTNWFKVQDEFKQK